MKMTMTDKLVMTTVLCFTMNQLSGSVQTETHLFDVHHHLNKPLRAGTEENKPIFVIIVLTVSLHETLTPKKLVPREIILEPLRTTWSSSMNNTDPMVQRKMNQYY